MQALDRRNPRGWSRGFPDHFYSGRNEIDRLIYSLSPSARQAYGGLKQRHIDWLIGNGVTTDAMVQPIAMRFAGTEPGGDVLAFEETDDWVLWQPKTRRLLSEYGNAFALGQDVIWEAATYSFDCHLNVFTEPLAWLQNRRDGIVIVDWSRAFEELRDCPRIAVTESVLATFEKYFKPQRMPEIFVLTERRAAA